ncbi:uncharacterized protein ASPGLDRAFT_854452 [Aspergillus glaucus CBS 516.65]|uniref:Uncharacterized protein n=1 Tax=Aspergillus glaucus CBS 516.65 TaxID=1160497 RepID=A0A1L9V9H3_ASPGL|nr:hypothetical protein ASPGLDRAFT_854452 [Aspergillus glaucus CBS 516.65]OJJ80578.1 hypothetical protein ASPGLDRAFT_854452 [Aspergillus glaucus CBS 516.65]
MSRNFIPAVLAIGMGVFTGYYTFQPALKDLEHEKNFSKEYAIAVAVAWPCDFRYIPPSSSFPSYKY